MPWLPPVTTATRGSGVGTWGLGTMGPPMVRLPFVQDRRAPRVQDGRMTAAVVLADTAGRITAWDPGAERLFGHPAAHAVGCSLDLIVPPELRTAHWAGFHRAMATGTCRLD